jgi:hypothetical protein
VLFSGNANIQYLQPTTSSKKKLNIHFFSKNISSSLLTKKSKETHIRSHPMVAIRVIIAGAMSEVMADFWQANELADAAAKSWYALPMVHQLEAAAPS